MYVPEETRLTWRSSFSGRREGQGSAVLSSLLLSAAGPGQKPDQRCKGSVFKEETQRGFCQQTQVMTVMFFCGRSTFYCTDFFYEKAPIY